MHLSCQTHESLESRRDKLCLKFAKKAVKNDKHTNWFIPKADLPTRQVQNKYCKVVARTDRFMTSPKKLFDKSADQ